MTHHPLCCSQASTFASWRTRAWCGSCCWCCCYWFRKMYSTTHCLFCTIMSERRSWNTALCSFLKRCHLGVLTEFHGLLLLHFASNFSSPGCKYKVLSTRLLWYSLVTKLWIYSIVYSSLFQKICSMHMYWWGCYTKFTWWFHLS